MKRQEGDPFPLSYRSKAPSIPVRSGRVQTWMELARRFFTKVHEAGMEIEQGQSRWLRPVWLSLIFPLLLSLTLCPLSW